MILENQEVKIKWSNKTKAYYIDKGYAFTSCGDEFMVKVEDLMPTVKIDVDVQCDYCGKIFKKTYGGYNLEISKKIKKCACNDCKGKKLKESLQIDSNINIYNEFIDICSAKGYTPLTQPGQELNCYTLLSYECPIHGIQEHPIDYMRKFGCHGCKLDATQAVKAENAIQQFYSICSERGYKPISTVEDYVTDESYLYYECPKHGLQKNKFRDFKRGRGCNGCRYMAASDSQRLTPDEVKSYIESKNGNTLLNPDDYVRAIENNLIIKCGSCGEPFTCSLNNYQKSVTGKCPACNGNSIGETVINEYLNELGIEHMWHYSFHDCRDKNALPFDFYLPKYNCIIEFDGIHHYEPVYGEDRFQKTISHDAIKNEYCKNNNIEIIRIPYWEFSNIKPIISNALHLTKFPQIIKHNKNPYL